MCADTTSLDKDKTSELICIIIKCEAKVNTKKSIESEEY